MYHTVKRLMVKNFSDCLSIRQSFICQHFYFYFDFLWYKDSIHQCFLCQICFGYQFAKVFLAKKFFYFMVHIRIDTDMHVYTHTHATHTQHKRYITDRLITITGALFQIILQPSDVIYIPPYWFHEVVTMEPSISINVWRYGR